MRRRQLLVEQLLEAQEEEQLHVRALDEDGLRPRQHKGAKRRLELLNGHERLLLGEL